MDTYPNDGTGDVLVVVVVYVPHGCVPATTSSSGRDSVPQNGLQNAIAAGILEASEEVEQLIPEASHWIGGDWRKSENWR